MADFEITQEMEVNAAVQMQLAAIERYASILQTQPVAHNGHSFYADLDATRTIEVTLLIYAGLADSDPVPVPYPLQAGYWMSADSDQSGNRVVVPMTMADFRAMGKALMERNAAIWGKKQIHFATLEAMAAEGASATDILAYDITEGW